MYWTATLKNDVEWQSCVSPPQPSILKWPNIVIISTQKKKKKVGGVVLQKALITNTCHKSHVFLHNIHNKETKLYVLQHTLIQHFLNNK